jgi:hypothetical protein
MAQVDWNARATVRLRCAHGRGELAGLRDIPLADALRIVMEDFPRERRAITLIDLEGRTLRALDIKAMYDSRDYPRRSPDRPHSRSS